MCLNRAKHPPDQFSPSRAVIALSIQFSLSLVKTTMSAPWWEFGPYDWKRPQMQSPTKRSWVYSAISKDSYLQPVYPSNTHYSKQLACLPDIRLHCTTTPSSEVRCRSRGNPTAECDSQEGATKKNGQSVLWTVKNWENQLLITCTTIVKMYLVPPHCAGHMPATLYASTGQK